MTSVEETESAGADNDENVQMRRELRAANLGQAWAENTAYKRELHCFAEWRALLRKDEWEHLFFSSEEQFHDTAEGVIGVMMPDIYAVMPRFPWDRWCEWLQLESAEEVQPEEVQAFLDAAFEVWQQGNMVK